MLESGMDDMALRAGPSGLQHLVSFRLSWAVPSHIWCRDIPSRHCATEAMMGEDIVRGELAVMVRLGA